VSNRDLLAFVAIGLACLVAAIVISFITH